MGTDKRTLVLGGLPLLEHITKTSQSTGCNVFGVEEDLQAGQGPLGGVETAFATFPVDWILFLPCDMPFLRSDTMLHVLRTAIGSGRAVFAEVEGRIGFPFALSREHLGEVRQRLRAGQRSLKGLARALNGAGLRFSEEEAVQFLNINKPEDLETARRWWDRRQ